MSSDKQHKLTLLVDQDEALDFYLGSLLSSEENEQPEEEKEAVVDTQAQTAELKTEAETTGLRTEQLSQEPVDRDRLQAAKEFLQASKQRQQRYPVETTAVAASEHIDKPESAPEQAVLKQESSTTPASGKMSQVITAGPVSPKPREHYQEEAGRKTEAGQSIVFSKTDKEGKITEEVLIPRSQKLASATQSEPISSAAKTFSRTGEVTAADMPTPATDMIPDSSEKISPEPGDQAIQGVQSEQSPQLEKSPQPEQTFQAATHGQSEVQSSPEPGQSPQAEEANKTPTTKEAPKLDLSLFLPKIKTLSEEEIARQIEALTQAAVSQAQLETDLAQIAQVQRSTTETLASQTDSGALIRNVDNAPAWAVPDFQVLLFAVAGLKLAVPLSELNGIVEWGDEYITEMPGHAPWYLGLIQNQGKNVPVIDTLQQVVPENRWPSDYLKQRNFKHIILIDNGQWGLACETVLEVITLKTDSVKWRSSRTKRRWLLGTVIEHMCALLDSAEFAAMLKTGEDSLIG